ncbi:exopolyphosphatase [Pectinatus frisingensis]|uniref:Ppx/GppA phosphatase family protein n=1 Tax=Pectinatus frisingensis TaxID=865 RepID=UPI0018C62D50|nr:exopolyphosphatase [Pectinatus frisingensis]
MLYAVIDIGSSTIRMAIYNIEYGKIEMLTKKKHLIGLAGYVKNNLMQQQGIDKACDSLNEFRDFLVDFHIKNVSAFATAAIRNVKNSRAVVDELQKRTGIAIRVITGDEEAAFDFIGVMHGVDVPTGLIIDVGGGSTELIYYIDKNIEKKISLPLGALSLHTDFVEDFLPSSAEVNDMERYVTDALKKADGFTVPPAPYICGIGGTIKSMRILYNHLFQCNDDNMMLKTADFITMIKKYMRDTAVQEKDIIMLLKSVPDRLQTIVPGMVIIDIICRYFQAEQLTYSDTGMREGYIYDQIISAEQ